MINTPSPTQFFFFLFTLLSFTNISNSYSSKIINSQLTIQESPLVSSIQLQGHVMPLDTIDIAAPTNAKISTIYIQLGEKIKKNQKILELKSDQLEIDIRNATEMLIRAEIDYNKKKSWQESDDVFQAKQSHMKNKLSFKRSDEIFKQNKLLYKQGIISHNELQQSEIAHKEAKYNLELSDRHLKRTFDQGDATQIKLLKLALENAQAKLDILNNIKQQLNITSPIDGVILRAKEQDKINKNNRFISIGQSVSTGENLIAIGNLNGFTVDINANEQIVQNIKLNQQVTIQLPALLENNIYTGIITAIDAQPNNSDLNIPPKYNIKILANDNKINPQNIQNKIFLGMTAKINFDLVEKEKSLLIPFASINYDNNNQAYVIDNHNQHINITLGKSTHDKIEVLTGLKPGDIIKQS